MIKIVQVAAHLMWPIRHQVMYPEEDFASIKLAEDEQGIHLALFAQEELVSVLPCSSKVMSYNSVSLQQKGNIREEGMAPN